MSDFKINSIANKNGDFGPVIAGVSTVNSTGCMTLPRGSTERRGPRSRGIFGGGTVDPANLNLMDFINIQSNGNAVDFGDLTSTRGRPSGVANATRGLFVGGTVPSSPNYTNAIEYITMSSLGNSEDFADVNTAVWQQTGGANDTRAVVGGGYGPSPFNVNSNVIDTFTIATLGVNASDFGDLLYATREHSGTASPTRVVWFGGRGDTGVSDAQNTIQFITIATTGNSVSFGDLPITSFAGNASSNGVRGFHSGASSSSPFSGTSIFVVTMATEGEATEYDDLVKNPGYLPQLGTVANSNKAIVAGGVGTGGEGELNNIQSFSMATTGQSADFGDLVSARYGPGGVSDSHGGVTE